MGDDKSAKKTSSSVLDVSTSVADYLPNLTSQLTDASAKGAQQDWYNTAAYSPAYTNLTTSLYGTYAPKLAKTAREIDAADKLSGAQADLAVVQGSGGDMVKEVQSLDELVNPEYYATRKATSNTIGDLLSGQLTDAEREEITRSLLSSNVDAGTLGVGSNANTVGNAMTFGEKSLARQTTGAQLANSFLPSSTRDLGSTYNIAKGTKADSSGGTSQFTGAQKNLGSSTQSQAGNIVSSIFGQENTSSTEQNKQGDSWYDVLNSLSESATNIASL